MLPEKKISMPAEGEKAILPLRLKHHIAHNSSRIIVIRAASGFGKTTAVCAHFSEAERAGEKVFWYRADLTDRDPERMLFGFETLILGQSDASGQEPVMPRHERIDRLVAALNAIKEPAYLIVDDLQELGEEDSLALLLLLLRYTERTRFILLTNRELHASLHALVLKEEAVLFDAGDLILGPEDTKTLITKAMTPDGEKTPDGKKPSQTLDEKLVRRICDGFGGWGLGVTKALSHISGLPDHGKQFLKKDPEGFWKNLLTQTGLESAIAGIFPKEMSAEAGDLLMNAALLGEFEEDLCRFVTEDEFSDRVFSEVVSIPGVCQSLRDGWYRIGEAFAVHIASEAKPSEKKRVCALAAGWYREHGDFAQMTAYALRAEDERLLIEALEKNGVGLLTGRVALGRILTYLESRRVNLPPEAAGVAAQYHYLEGRLDLAERYLNEADSAFGKENRFGTYRSLYRALAHYEEDEDKYTRQIRSAVFFLKEAGDSFPRITEADERRIANVMQENTAGEKLRVTTFGRFRVVVGQEEKELAWRTRKGRELFAYLLDIEGEAVDRRQLMDTLWPEEIPENAVAMLHNMIYNMRKELSDYRLEKLIVYESKRYRLNMDEIETDSIFWRRLAGYVKQKDVVELAHNIDAFLIYPGRYLDDIDNTWAAEKREYYDGIYRTGCELLAEHMCEQGEKERAIQLYGNILMTDPYSERTIEKLIRLYGECREWGKMKKCYEDFKVLLKKDLGIEPEESVIETYRSFRAG